MSETMTDRELELQLLVEDLQAKLAKASEPKGVLIRVSKPNAETGISKGAVSIYGFGHFPVTQYAATWLKILDMGDNIRAFIKAHESELSWK